MPSLDFLQCRQRTAQSRSTRHLRPVRADCLRGALNRQAPDFQGRNLGKPGLAVAHEMVELIVAAAAGRRQTLVLGPDRRSVLWKHPDGAGKPAPSAPVARGNSSLIGGSERKVRTPSGRIPGEKRCRAGPVGRKAAGRKRFCSSRGAAGQAAATDSATEKIPPGGLSERDGET